jgi:hypothetical protein
MKISIADVKKRLGVGVEFVGEFVGDNAKFCRPGMEKTRRRVVTNNTQLVSEFLDGPKVGQVIYCKWAGVTADERDGGIFLTSDGEEFLKITI